MPTFFIFIYFSLKDDALLYCFGFKRKETQVYLWLTHADTLHKATHAQLLDQSCEFIHVLFKSLIVE